jgi:acetolactate synthase I/II/III large subunit
MVGKKLRVADYIIGRLAQQGVSHFYMVTGRGALFLTDAVAANKEVEAVSMHHEQSAAYATVAHSQYSGNMGACIVSTGCASTNAVTGVLNAWQDGLPCIFISGQNKLEETSRFTGLSLRTYGQQEADIIPVVSSITKHAVMISDPNQIAYELEKAIYLAITGRKGPVWIDVPLDVQNMRVDVDEMPKFTDFEDHIPAASNEEIIYVQQHLNNSQRPIVLIGSGVHSSGAKGNLIEFIKTANIPMVFSASAPDIYGSKNELSIGSIGLMGTSRAANFAIQNADFILVIGNRLNTMVTGIETDKFGREARLVVVDIDEVEHSKLGNKIDRFIKSDAKLFLQKLIKNKLTEVNDEWRQKCLHWKSIFPKCEPSYEESEKVDLYALTKKLSLTMPSNGSLVTDSGVIELVLPNNFEFEEGQRSIHPVSQGSMGFALPAAIGAYFASKKPVLAVIGDGSIMMNLQEFEVIRHHNLPIKVIIINNNVYSVIRKRQVDLFRRRTIGTDPSNGVSVPDFDKVADTFGMEYLRINDPKELESKLISLFQIDNPAICEVMGVEEQDYIHSSYVINAERKIVNRPIEDQKPYIDREIFMKEMIIKPIDQ